MLCQKGVSTYSICSKRIFTGFDERWPHNETERFKLKLSTRNFMNCAKIKQLLKYFKFKSILEFWRSKYNFVALAFECVS